MSELPKRRRQSCRERHVARAPAFRCGDLNFPFGALNTELSLVQIDVTPLQRDHLAASVERVLRARTWARKIPRSPTDHPPGLLRVLGLGAIPLLAGQHY